MLFGWLVIAMIRAWQKPWWSVSSIRRALIALVALAPLGFLCRWFGVGAAIKGFQSPFLSAVGATVGGGATVLVLALFLTVPIASLLRAAIGWVGRRRRAPGEVEVTLASDEAPQAPSGNGADAPTLGIERDVRTEERAAAPLDPAPVPSPASPVASRGPTILTRRHLVEAAVAALPVTALGLGVTGIVGGFTGARTIERRMRFAGLAPELEGLRVLQLTDMHLGAFLTLDGVDALVAQAKEARPDLVVLTGDISDHLPWLPEALRGVESIGARLGAYAVMGNHEYFRGARETRRIYAESQVRLLDDAHVPLDVGGKRLVLLGVDDPVGGFGGSDHYARSADRALASSPSEADFRLALCHRPSGFRALAARGVDLTLSGHTHGAQAGLHERSLLEPLLPDAYLWGRYELEGRQLYTSSGAGHWAAFRLACPSEAPLIVLEGDASAKV